jgi:hypothetical protein
MHGMPFVRPTQLSTGAAVVPVTIDVDGCSVSATVAVVVVLVAVVSVEVVAVVTVTVLVVFVTVVADVVVVVVDVVRGLVGTLVRGVALVVNTVDAAVVGQILQTLHTLPQKFNVFALEQARSENRGQLAWSADRQHANTLGEVVVVMLVTVAVVAVTVVLVAGLVLSGFLGGGPIEPPPQPQHASVASTPSTAYNAKLCLLVALPQLAPYVPSQLQSRYCHLRSVCRAYRRQLRRWLSAQFGVSKQARVVVTVELAVDDCDVVAVDVCDVMAVTDAVVVAVVVTVEAAVDVWVEVAVLEAVMLAVEVAVADAVLVAVDVAVLVTVVAARTIKVPAVSTIDSRNTITPPPYPDSKLTVNATSFKSASAST